MARKPGRATRRAANLPITEIVGEDALTTLVVGEEGHGLTTLIAGEEHPTTFLNLEEGPTTLFTVGEENPSTILSEQLTHVTAEQTPNLATAPGGEEGPATGRGGGQVSLGKQPKAKRKSRR